VRDFRLALPVACVDSLHQLAKFCKGRGLANTQDFIFDTIWKTVVEVVAESTFSIPTDL
jgi:hypothetical protein